MEIILGIVMFTVIVLVLALMILFAKSKLVSEGDITIKVNNGRPSCPTSANAKRAKAAVCLVRSTLKPTWISKYRKKYSA
ncbi:Na(+)-translocating NADH-quinone reductase subunit F [Mycobacteroides abscessus subsp. massiliense]|nr:Na(+)-translocating NADH-quinone reductase subunit F [Mycobacteroides abscessus subsp. massiliense]